MMTPQQHRVEVLPTSDLLIILVCGGDGHPVLCPAALELIERVREGRDDAKDGLVELAENRSLVAQAALLELGVEQCVQEAELLNADWQRDTWIGLRLHSRPRLEQASNILRESEPGLAAN